MFEAWGDESESQANVDPGVYMLAAALCEDDHQDDVRIVMEAARLKHEKKVHWHGRNDVDRQHIAEMVSSLRVNL